MFHWFATPPTPQPPFPPSPLSFPVSVHRFVQSHPLSFTVFRTVPLDKELYILESLRPPSPPLTPPPSPLPRLPLPRRSYLLDSSARIRSLPLHPRHLKVHLRKSAKDLNPTCGRMQGELAYGEDSTLFFVRPSGHVGCQCHVHIVQMFGVRVIGDLAVPCVCSSTN